MRIAVIGAGGHGREVAQTIQRAGSLLLSGLSAGAHCEQEPLVVAGFYDDNGPSPATDRLGLRILGASDACDLPAVIGIGSGAVRERFDARMRSAPAVVDPSAFVGDDLDLPPGCVAFAGAMMTTNISIGRHVHVGRGASIGHDSVLGDYVSVMPLASVSGNVTIGARAFIGTGALIRQGVTIGSDATIGMGAVVLRDVPDGATVVGNPARPVAQRRR